MLDVLIIANSSASVATPSSVTPSNVHEMKRAIQDQDDSPDGDRAVTIWSNDQLESGKPTLTPETLICPLTLDLPAWLPFAWRDLYKMCADVAQLQQQVADWQYSVGSGTNWLPIVLTAKGPLYAEAITQTPNSAFRFKQPLHLSDAQRQPLYQLGQRLLRSLDAPPSVYLMQFGISGDRVWFDRLLPFPDMPAITSVGIQDPDLFTCHWRCLWSQPIRELSIMA